MKTVGHSLCLLLFSKGIVLSDASIKERVQTNTQFAH